MKKRMIRRMLIMLLTIGLLFGAIVGYQMFVASMMKKFMSANAQPPATVTAMQARRESWQRQETTVGTLRAMRGVDISSEVGGIVQKVHFTSGQQVQKGTLLFELDASEEVAQLEALKASRRLAEINHKRDQEQFARQAVSQAQFDASETELNRLKAEVDRQKAAVDKKRIRAPFSGRLGVTTINPGQFIDPSEKLVTLQDNRTLYVDFKLPQRLLSQLKKGQTIHVKSDTGINRDGHIKAINAAVDPATRNLALEGLIENSDEALLPGMFVQVAIDIGAPEALLTLPQTAVSYNPYGSTLFVARTDGADSNEDKPTLKAHQIFVRTGPRRGDQIAIVDGLGDGDMVVTSGQMKLKNGTPLIIDNTVTPANDIAPRPREE
jgi:membrane fusion protein (multidrug efflux system)